MHNCILQGILYCDSLLSCGKPIYGLCSRSQYAVHVARLQNPAPFPVPPPLFDILNQCDNLIFRHFLFLPSPSAVLLASRLMLPLRLSFPVFLPHSPLASPCLPVKSPSLSVPASILSHHHSLRLFLTFIFLIRLTILPPLSYVLTLCLVVCWSSLASSSTSF